MSFTGKRPRRHAEKDLSLIAKLNQDGAAAAESDSDVEVASRNRAFGRRLRPRQSLGQPHQLDGFTVVMPERKTPEAQPAQFAVAAPAPHGEPVIIPGLEADDMLAPHSPLFAHRFGVSPNFSMASDFTECLQREARAARADSVFDGLLFDPQDLGSSVDASTGRSVSEVASLSPSSDSSSGAALTFAAAAGVAAIELPVSSDRIGQFDLLEVPGK